MTEAPASPGRWTSALQSRWLALAVLTLVTGFALWPVSALGEQIFLRRDTFFALVVIDHLQDALAGEVSWRDAPLAWPLSWGITQFDWVGGLAVLGLPLTWLGLDPLQQHGMLVMLAYLSCGWVLMEAARALLGPGVHTWFAGVLGALSPAHLAEAANVNLVHHEVGLAGVVLAAAALHRRQPALALAAGGLVGVAGHFGIYVGIHAGVALALVVGVAGLARRAGRRELGAMALGLAAGLTTLAPVLWTYAESSALYDIQYSQQQRGSQATWLTSFMLPNPHIELHAKLGALLRRDFSSMPLNPGYGAAALAAWGLRCQVRRGWSWLWSAVLTVATMGAALSLGPVVQTHFGSTGVPGPSLLLDLVPGMASLRAPRRWMAVSFFALALFAAAGAQDLLRRRRALAAGLALLCLVELPDLQWLGEREAVALHPVYEHVVELQVPGALYDVRAAGNGDGKDRVYAVLQHHRPRIGGTYARTSTTHDAVNRMALSWPAPAADTLLRVAGVTVVLERLQKRPRERTLPEDADCSEVAGHRLCVLPPWPGGIPAEVTTDAGGDPVGLRFETPLPAVVTLSCGEDHYANQSRAWQLITALRDGARATWTDIYLPAPCAGPITTDGPVGRPLHRVGEMRWARPLPTPR